ncbi:MAG: hypothetical protein IKW89_02655 [Bacteroidales bacterium]|nr:hypothetical protein [Bacteroidales bacterium]
MKHKLHITGVEVDLSLPTTDILATIQASLDRFYPNQLVKADSYTEKDERTIEIVFIRNLPYEYCNVVNSCISYIDASILSGLPEDNFEFNPVSGTQPIIGPLIPWGKCWFVPISSFTSLLKQMNETLLGEIISRMQVDISTDKIIVKVKYPRAKGRYDDDVLDLESELDGPLENHRGETLRYRLKDLGQICERPQIKTKSYMGLKSYLKKAYDITLEIL